MPTSRGSFAAGVVLTTLGLVLTGCGNSGGNTGTAQNSTPSPSVSSAPADPKQALASSTSGIVAGNYSFTSTGHEQQAKGTNHKPSESAKVEVTGGTGESAVLINVLYVERELWVKFSKPKASPGKWYHIDPQRAKSIEDLQFDWDESDLTNAPGVMNAVVSAERAADGSYSGTTDLSKVKDGGPLGADSLKGAGDKAKAVPFRATLDDQGRLSALTLKLPATADEPAHDLKLTYTGYGTATPTAKPPAAETQKATEDVYQLFT